MAEQSTYAANQAEVAWLEKALYLAAQELAAFRASASAERERANQALREVEGRLRALEAERSEAERRHAVELERAQARFEAELAERAKAWSELGQDVAKRGEAVAAVHARYQLELERTAQLGRELADARQQLKAAAEARETLLAEFTKLEEQFQSTAASAREAKELGVASRVQLDRMNLELDQSIARCRQLEGEARALSLTLNERSEDCESAERALATVKGDLSEAQARVQTLERAGSELQSLRPELERERDMRKQANDTIERIQAELEAQKRATEKAEAEVAERKKSLEAAQNDLQTARRERDEIRRDLEQMQRARAEQVAREKEEALKSQTSRSERELSLELELEQARTSKNEREQQLQRELDAARRELENAKREQAGAKHELDARTQAELEAARKDRDEARRELAQHKRDLEQRSQAELEALRRERDQALRELEEHSGARLAMLDLEKDRVAKLKVELEETQRELERTRSERETMREELAHQQRMASGGSPLKVEAIRMAERIEREQQMTVPIPGRGAPANENEEPPAAEPAADQPPPAPERGEKSGRKSREGAYSVTHVEEEQVFVRKGGGGGRGTR